MIEWIEKVARTRNLAEGCNVTVALSKHGDKYATQICFYNDCFRRITSGKYIKVGTSNDRIYFDESRNGYKLQNYGNKDSQKSVRVNATLKEFVGSYTLQYDAYEKCYCIVKGNKKVD